MFFEEFIYLDTVGSTNSYLKESCFKNRTIVWTYNQTQGRGRENRAWIDFKDKNLALSILFLENDISNIVWYIATTSLSIIDTLLNYGINNGWIKWPNDVYIQTKKLAGILAESIWNNGKIERLIIGIGININTDKNELLKINKEATSIAIEKNSSVNIEDFTKNFIYNLDKRFNELLITKNIKKIREEWLKHSKIIGKEVEWVQPFEKEKFNGIVKDIDMDGFLILKIGNDLVKVTSGDIILKNID